MFRMMSLVAGLFLAIASFAVAQEPQHNQQTPEDAFGTRQLIAWSNLQKPQPAPQPLPPRDSPIPEPGQQPDQQAKSPADPQSEQSPAQSFTGKIVKEGAEYVLRAASNTTYELEEQGEAKQYENQNVRVTGTLDPTTHKIHILKIELMS
jgi:uncharacterized protein DUF5818